MTFIKTRATARSSAWCEPSIVFPPRKVLIVDHDRDRAKLLTGFFRREFPQAELHSFARTETAAKALANDPIDAVVLHRRRALNAATAIRILREVRDVPIIVVCRRNRQPQFLAAGATAFLTYDDLPYDAAKVCISRRSRRGTKSPTRAKAKRTLRRKTIRKL